MLTISQLAAYTGVTVRAVRHYHQVGLLPEPERNSSGYRTYDAAAVVRLVRIRTLAEAGVPLARVQELLDATPEEFAAGIEQVDADLRAEIRRLQDHRKRIARLAAGESLALPQSAVDYLARLRALGVDERIIALERDAWIMIAAYDPDRIDSFIADKQRQLDHDDVVRLYRMLGDALGWSEDDERVVELVDLLERMIVRDLEDGGADLGGDDFDDPFVDLLDATVLETSPIAGRMMRLLEERGWKGWTRLEEVPPGWRSGAGGQAAARRTS
jgi:DNA-binding transcriptional MerR regulator